MVSGDAAVPLALTTYAGCCGGGCAAADSLRVCSNVEAPFGERIEGGSVDGKDLYEYGRGTEVGSERNGDSVKGT